MKNLSITAVVLAAGNSSRMGRSKMALKWGDSTVLETTIAHVQQAKVRSLLLVTGGYRDVVERLPLVQKIPRVHNENYAVGEMISSIKIALETIKAGHTMPDGILVLPGDMPLVTTSIIDKCIAEWHQSPEKIVAPTYEGKRGHPVIFPMQTFAQFETLPAQKSPRDLLKANQSLLKLFSLDTQAIRIDVDTPVEYSKYRPGNTVSDE